MSRFASPSGGVFRALLVIALLGLCAIGYGLWPQHEARAAASVVRQADPARHHRDQPRRAVVSSSLREPGREPLPPRPASLADTEIDGALRVTRDGSFVADAGALRLFEYFLAARGELEEAQLERLIAAEIERRLPASARPEALAFLDRYLAYRREAGELAELAQTDDGLELAVEQLYALRREHFGEEGARRAFAEDEALRTTALARRQARLAESLPAAERQRLEIEAESTLPPHVREARAQALMPQAVGEARKASDDPRIVRAELEALVGKAATARLEALERQRAAFAREFAAYERERAALRARQDLSADELTRAEAALLERSFAPSERARALALTRRY